MSDNAHADAVARQLTAVADEDIPERIRDRRESLNQQSEADDGEMLVKTGDSEEADS